MLKSPGAAWSLGLGTLIGITPMLLAYSKPLRHGRPVDPFDIAMSYEIWLGGIFCLAAVLATRLPEQSWRLATLAGLGLPAGFLLFFAVTPATIPNLWPLGLILCGIIGLPAAFAGALAGSTVSRFLPVH